MGVQGLPAMPGSGILGPLPIPTGLSSKFGTPLRFIPAQVPGGLGAAVFSLIAALVLYQLLGIRRPS